MLKINKTHVFTGHSGPVYSLCRDEKRNILFSVSGDGTVMCRDLSFSSAPFVFLKSDSPLYTFAMHESLVLAGNYRGVVHVADANEKSERRAIILHEGPVFSLLISRDGRYWLSGGGDGKVHLMDASHTRLRTLQVGQGKIRSLQLNNDESELLVACGDGHACVYSFPDLQPLASVATNEFSCNAAVYDPLNKNHVFSGGRDAHLVHADLSSGKILQKIPAHYYAIYSILIDKEAGILLTASRDKSIKAWDLRDLSFRCKLDEHAGGHTRSVNTISWIVPGKSFVSAGDDKQLILWDIAHP